MNITLSVTPGVTTLCLHHPAPVPAAFEMAIGSNDSMLWHDSESEHLPESNWETVSADSGLTLRREFHGPFGLCSAMRWCQATQRTLARALAIYSRQPVPKEDVSYPMTFALGEQQGLSFEQLEALYEELPAYTYPLGTLQLTQPTLRITDPCYQVGTWCAVTLQAKPGAWLAKSVVGPTSWHTRVKVLQISHETLGDVDVADYKTLEHTELNAGVDSAQCGFFDDALYPRDAAAFEYEGDTFYGQCCKLTLDRGLPGGGVLASQAGVLTSSGFGDGGYDVFVQRDAQGEVVLVQLLFIDESVQDDEDEDAVADEEA